MKKTNLLLASFLLTMTSCDLPFDLPFFNNSEDESENNSETESASEVVKGEMKLANSTVIYDGTVKSIEVTNLPDGATVSYKNNYQVEPGKYSVTATVTLKDGTVKTLTASLQIKKGNSTLKVDDNQTVSSKDPIPAFSLSNSEQVIKCEKIYKAGTYSIELYAEATDHYYESNHVTVTINVEDYNPSGVVFESKKEAYTGDPISLSATNFDPGYHIEYVNNTHTEQGTYNVVCKVLDANNNLVSVHRAILTIEKTENAEFKKYMDDFFVEYLEGDYYGMNIFLEHPENFGFERDPEDEATWYTYEPVSDQDMLDAYNDFLDYKAELEEFDVNTLSPIEQISYRKVESFLDNYIAQYNPDNHFNFLMDMNYIDQFGGYPSDFATCMEAYEFRNVNDIEDTLSMIKSLPTAYASYITYGQDRITAGYALSDYTLDEMKSFVDEIVTAGENYYLKEVLKNKVDGVDFLEDSSKEDYKDDFDNYFKDYFVPANEALSTGLESLKGNCTNEGYLSTYQYGKEKYVLDLCDLLGFDVDTFDAKAYEKELKDGLSKYMNLYQNVLREKQSNPLGSGGSSEYESLSSGSKSIIGITEPLEQLEFLKEFAKTIVPGLDNQPDINVKNMDLAAASKSNAVAYYMKSALDSTTAENITLNPTKLQGNYNECLFTLAHEGYPGHLYAYLFDKSLDLSNFAKIATSTAHGEGWATYVTYKLYDYVIENNVCEYQNAAKYYCLEEKYWGVYAYLLYTYIDFGIGYYGWNANDVASAMSRQGLNTSGAGDIYKMLIEIPTQYASYGYGQLVMLNVHEQAQEELGYYYDEIEFNTAVLSHGWCPLSELKQIAKDYIASKKFLYQSPVEE